MLALGGGTNLFNPGIDDVELGLGQHLHGLQLHDLLAHDGILEVLALFHEGVAHCSHVNGGSSRHSLLSSLFGTFLCDYRFFLSC